MFRLLIVLVALVTLAAPTNAGDQNFAKPDVTEIASLAADQYLKQKVARVLSELGQMELGADEREQRFRALVTEIFDVQFISRFVLGAHWNTTPPSEQERFINSLIELQVQNWAQRFKPSIEISAIVVGEPRVNDRGHYFVPMTMKDSATNADTQTLLWALRKEDNNFKVFDVVVDGTSLLITYKNEYQSFINRHGSVAKLSDEIERKTRMASSASAN